MAASEARVPLLHEERRPAHVSIGVESAASPASSTPPLLVSLCAGAAAGAIAKTVVAPLDRTKINFQISSERYSWRAAWQFALSSVQRGGVSSLWRGNSATMARIVPYAGVQFAAHEQWKRLLGIDTSATAKEHPVLLVVAGSLAGVTSQSATYPLDVTRARMAVATENEYRTLTKALSTIVREEGARALFRGYVPTVLGVIPYAGVSFFTYDTLKRKYKERFGGSAGGVHNVVLGGAAGALAQTASYPLDIVRRRMQTCRRQTSLLLTLHAIYTGEGWRGFFKGLSMNWVKGPIAVGVSFATYDAIKATVADLMAAVHR